MSNDVGAVLDTLYEAYFAGDAEGMVAVMANDVEVRFLGRAAMVGRTAALEWFSSNNATLQDLDFRIRRRLIDGSWAAVVWDETAVARGLPYTNHGVDVFRVVDGAIEVLHVSNDVVARRAAFDSTPDSRHSAGST